MMKNYYRAWMGIVLLLAGVLLAGCGGGGGEGAAPVGQVPAASEQAAATRTTVPTAAVQPAVTSQPTATATVPPTADAQKTQNAQATKTVLGAQSRTLTAGAPTRTTAPTRTQAPTRTPVPTPFKPPVYGMFQSYQMNTGSGGEQAWQLPGSEVKAALDPNSEAVQSPVWWDGLRWADHDWQQPMVRIDQAEGFSSCSIWRDGDWQRVIQIPESQISLLAESIVGRQQVWIWDCALSGDGMMLGLNIIGGGTQWYDRSVIYTVNVDGSNLSPRTPSVFETVYMGVFWHPYEPILFYEYAGEGYLYEYQTYNVETAQRWTASGDVEILPDTASFSPDGRWFTFLAYDKGIYYADVLNAGAPGVFMMIEDLEEVVWSPSGSQLLGIYWIDSERRGAKVFEVSYYPPTGQPDGIVAITDEIVLDRDYSLFWIPWRTQSEEQSVCDGAGVSSLQAGDYAYANPDVKGAFQYREAADGGAKVVGSLRAHQRVVVMSGPRCTEGKVWWQVFVPETKKSGWIIERDGGEKRLIPLIPPEGRHAQAAAGTGEANPPAAGGEATPTPSAPAAAAQVCPGAPATQLQVGMQAMVSTESSTPNRVRAEPSSSGQQVGLLPPGTKMTIEEGPSCGNNFTWWKVSATVDGQKITGWTVEGDMSDYWVVPVK